MHEKSDSLFTPLLLCIQSLLLFELLALWLDELGMAIGCRAMILFFVGVICYFRQKPHYTSELATLLPLVLLQDIAVALVFRGLFSLYSSLCVYVPVVFLIYLHNRARIHELLLEQWYLFINEWWPDCPYLKRSAPSTMV